MLYRLELIKDQICLAALWDAFTDIVIKGKIVGQITIAQRFQVHMDDMAVIYAIIRQILMEQIQQG